MVVMVSDAILHLFRPDFVRKGAVINKNKVASLLQLISLNLWVWSFRHVKSLGSKAHERHDSKSAQRVLKAPKAGDGMS